MIIREQRVSLHWISAYKKTIARAL